MDEVIFLSLADALFQVCVCLEPEAACDKKDQMTRRKVYSGCGDLG